MPTPLSDAIPGFRVRAKGVEIANVGTSPGDYAPQPLPLYHGTYRGPSLGRKPAAAPAATDRLAAPAFPVDRGRFRSYREHQDMMKNPPQSVRIGIAVLAIVGAIGWLAYTGYASSKSYYVKIPELMAMGNKAYTRHLRVDGFVVPGSIVRSGPNVDFVIDEYESHSAKAASGRMLRVSYKGMEPPPDTFKDDSEAVADGRYGRDGVFHATELQAKCASKYAPAQPGSTTGNAPGAASAPVSKPAS